MLGNVLTMAKGMNSRFPDGNSPYEIMTRLLEECGEVAVHILESTNLTIRIDKDLKAKAEELF